MYRNYRGWGAGVLGALLAWQAAMLPARAQEGAAGEPEDPNILYLEANAKKEGVIVRPSGLQIRIIKRGDGELPEPDSTVAVHYEGRLVDGTIFDSSYRRGEPATFPVSGVIRGWTEALILMQVGSVWEIVMPAKIAYGDEGGGSEIPPGATLIFKVELLAVQ